MNRKQFIESNGATCQNWTWSWSFVNEQERVIIFGAWDVFQTGSKALILSEEWELSRKGKKAPGYSQARGHIRLVEDEGYRLMTFPMIHSVTDEDDGKGASKIEGFTPTLSVKTLIRVGPCWYAADDKAESLLPEELNPGEELIEGAAKSVTVNSYERNPVARTRCLEHHGYACKVCSFNFEITYGAIGKSYIHVHHIVELSGKGGEYVVDPVNDLVPVCPNCHAMLHSTRPALKIEQLKKHLDERKTVG